MVCRATASIRVAEAVARYLCAEVFMPCENCEQARRDVVVAIETLRLVETIAAALVARLTPERPTTCAEPPGGEATIVCTVHSEAADRA